MPTYIEGLSKCFLPLSREELLEMAKEGFLVVGEWISLEGTEGCHSAIYPDGSAQYYAWDELGAEEERFDPGQWKLEPMAAGRGQKVIGGPVRP